MTTKPAKHKASKQPARQPRPRPIKNIEDETPIMPWIVADTVIEEVVYHVLGDTHASLGEWLYNRRDDFSENLSAKANQIYRHNERFRKQIKARGNAGRDQLYVWMRHWLAAELKDAMPDIYQILPRDFVMGHAPAGSTMPTPQHGRGRL